MNNDLEQFSEERLMALIHESSKPEIEALARIALSVKQAKAIGYVESKTTGTDRFILKGFYAQNINIGDSLYGTPHPAHTEQDGWIKCSEQLPSESSHDKCLLWNGHYIRYGKWLSPDCSGRNCCWHDDYDHKIKGRQITHWMPLPAAPKPECE